MKEYLKPELEYIKFKAEEIAASLGGGTGGTSDNDFTDEDFE